MVTFLVGMEAEGPVTAVRVAGELDVATADRLRDALHDAAREGDRIVLYLDGVSFIDARGLRTIVRAHEELGERLVLGSISVPVRRIIDLVEAQTGLQTGLAA